MTTKPLTVGAALIGGALVALLGACGPTSTTPAAPGPGGTTAAAQPAGGGTAPTCDLFPAAFINGALGTHVQEPQAQNLGTVVVCRYTPASGPGSVVLRIQRSAGAATFAAGRQVSDKSGLHTTDLPGFMDQAYTSVLKAGSIVTNTVVALKGDTELLVASPASVDQEKALLEQVVAKIG